MRRGILTAVMFFIIASPMFAAGECLISDKDCNLRGHVKKTSQGWKVIDKRSKGYSFPITRTYLVTHENHPQFGEIVHQDVILMPANPSGMSDGIGCEEISHPTGAQCVGEAGGVYCDAYLECPSGQVGWIHISGTCGYTPDSPCSCHLLGQTYINACMPIEPPTWGDPWDPPSGGGPGCGEPGEPPCVEPMLCVSDHDQLEITTSNPLPGFGCADNWDDCPLCTWADPR